MKKMIVGILSALSFCMATAASAQYLDANSIARESSRMAQSASQLQQIASYSQDFGVRTLANDAREIGFQSSTLWRSARGICGRPAADSVLLSQFEAACEPVQRLLDDYQVVARGCDYRVTSLVNDIASTLERLRGMLGDNGGEGGHVGEGGGGEGGPIFH